MKKTDAEISDIIRDVMLQACPPVRYGSESQVMEHAKTRERASRYCYRFAAHMQSDMPYQSDTEAINALAPVAVWFIGWAARQFAIAVIKLLWNRWHSNAESNGFICRDC